VKKYSILLKEEICFQHSEQLWVLMTHMSHIMSRWYAVNICDTKALYVKFCMHCVPKFVDVNHWHCSAWCRSWWV